WVWGRVGMAGARGGTGDGCQRIVRRLAHVLRPLLAAALVPLDHAYEPVEHVVGLAPRRSRMAVGVVGAGTRFRMPLETEGGTVGACEALEAAVKERDVGHAHIRWKARGINREAVILAGD